MRFILPLSLVILGLHAVLGYDDDESNKLDLLKRIMNILDEREKRGKYQAKIDELKAKVKCGDEEAMCDNGLKCFNLNKKCNERDDCGDNSDEKNCKNYKCMSGMESCESKTNKQCVFTKHKCDGNPDCDNGNDETNCGKIYKNDEYNKYFECKSDEFKCKNGRCIWNPFKCDGSDDCGDNSDELSCKKPKSIKENVGLSDSTKNQVIRALVKSLIRK